MLASASHEETGNAGVWLRVRTLNSAVFSFNTMVRAALDSLREACHTFSASRRIMASVSFSRRSDSNVSSAEIDWVGRFGSTGLLSTASTWLNPMERRDCFSLTAPNFRASFITGVKWNAAAGRILRACFLSMTKALRTAA